MNTQTYAWRDERDREPPVSSPSDTSLEAAHTVEVGRVRDEGQGLEVVLVVVLVVVVVGVLVVFGERPIE